MNQKQLLVVSMSQVGAGHLKAAEALVAAAHEAYPNWQVRHIDIADYLAAPLKTTVIKTYDFLAKNAPDLWGFLYKKSNTKERARRFNDLTGLLKAINASKWFAALSAAHPDSIICTHALPAELIRLYKKKQPLTAPMSTVVTDYDIHEMWSATDADHFFVATEKMKWKLIESGHAGERVHVTGIPVDPMFFKPFDATACAATYNVSPRQPVLLVLSGGQGFMKLSEALQELFALSMPFSLIAIAGKNESLLKDIQKLIPPPHITYRPLGWVDDLPNLIRLSSAVISKPGGLTVSECRAAGKFLIAFHPIPGQEEANALFLLEEGCGTVAHQMSDVVYYAARELQHPRRIAPLSVNPAEMILKTLLT